MEARLLTIMDARVEVGQARESSNCIHHRGLQLDIFHKGIIVLLQKDREVSDIMGQASRKAV